MQAQLVNNGNLEIRTSGTDRLTFVGDTSHLMAALGINTFFNGTNATTMQVNGNVVQNGNLLAVSSDGTTGNNVGALAMAELETEPVMNGQTFSEAYRSTVATLGIEGSRATQFLDTNQSILRELKSLQEQNAGVFKNDGSVCFGEDEEAINLIKFQQAFQASARIINTVDQMLNIIINQLGA